jgi:hypothetical protein
MLKYLIILSFTIILGVLLIAKIREHQADKHQVSIDGSASYYGVPFRGGGTR